MQIFSYTPKRTVLFDWISSLAATVMLGGAYLDAWAHRHLEASLESFFTPWHAVLYGGAALLGGVHIIAAFLNYQKGAKLSKSLPPEHMISLYGFFLFMLAGLFDLVWHQVFGIEADIEALYSPSHLLLMISAVVGVSGAWRSLFYDRDLPKKLLAWFPVVLSMSLTLSFLTFATQDFHPYVLPQMGSAAVGRLELADLAISHGLESIIIQSALLMGLVFITLKRWRMPVGSFTVLLGLNGVALAYMQDHFIFIATAAIAGFLLDLLWLFYQKDFDKKAAIRLFGFLAPFIVQIVYVVTLILTDTIWWTVHLWTGSAVIAGLTGLLVSFLIMVPGEK